MSYRSTSLRVLVVTATLAVLFAFAGTFVTHIGTAYADTPGFGPDISYIQLSLSGSAGPTQQSNYTGMINTLRNAAGHSYRNNVDQTQSNTYGLVSLDLVLPSNTNVTLWFTASNMYLVGFTNTYGTTYQFNDYDLMGTLNTRYDTNNPSNTLGFSSNYISLSGAAGQDRGGMQISYNAVWNAAYNLAYYTPSQGYMQVARSLLMMIQMTSESARFYDVYGMFSNIMLNPGSNYDGVPALQQNLENSWDPISTWATSISNDSTTPPLTVNGVGTLYSFSDAARYCALINTPNSNNDGWGHTEL